MHQSATAKTPDIDIQTVDHMIQISWMTEMSKFVSNYLMRESTLAYPR